MEVHPELADILLKHARIAPDNYINTKKERTIDAGIHGIWILHGRWIRHLEYDAMISRVNEFSYRHDKDFILIHDPENKGKYNWSVYAEVEKSFDVEISFKVINNIPKLIE